MNNQDDRPRRWLHRWGMPLLVIALLLVVLLGSAVYLMRPKWIGGWFGRSAAMVPPEAQVGDLIIADETAPWLLAVAAPVAALLHRGERVPLLLAASTPITKPLAALVQQARPEHTLVLAPASKADLLRELAGLSPETIDTESGPMDTSVLLAKRFWGASTQAVVAPGEDAGAIIMGAALAARLKVPLLVRDVAAPVDFLREALAELEVQQILVPVSNPADGADWAASLAPEMQVLGPRALQRRMVAASGATGVCTVVLARTPEEGSPVGVTAWLAPYIGAVRQSPVVLCTSDRAEEAERRLKELVDEEGILPRSVTILADYKSIGTNLVRVGDPLDEKHPAAGSTAPSYKIEAEPCVPTDFDHPVIFAIGRIPFSTLQAASTLFARGVVRQRLVSHRPAHVLMVANANPDPDDPGLSLCEAVGRVTAEEFKNCGIQIDESYRKPANSAPVVTAAGQANLIIYEGHGRYQRLFREATISASSSPRAENTVRTGSEGHSTRSVVPERHDSGLFDQRRAIPAAEEEPDPEFESGPPPVLSAEAARAEMRQFQQPTTLKGPLKGLPLVILQACGSSDIDFMDLVHQVGGVGLLGSSTSVHSGSGSALVKACVNGLLYRGDTLGEALRDAQNYFFCLQELKEARGHQQQAKTQRVALCFRLWGDPELQVFPQPIAKPARAAVSIAWDTADKLTINLPSRRLAESRTSAYVAWMFPGSEAAGMVKRVGDNAPRKLTPVYYFRLALPEGFTRADYATLACAEDTSNRAVFRVDPAGRFLYVLYYPRKEVPRETFLLQFMSRPQTQSGKSGETPPNKSCRANLPPVALVRPAVICAAPDGRGIREPVPAVSTSRDRCQICPTHAGSAASVEFLPEGKRSAPFRRPLG
jgi:hypothetical protein